MHVSLIVAMDRRGLIGDDAGLPWHLPKDLRRFRALTWGKPIVMGRRTFELIGKPLPGRPNIVLSRNAGHSAPGCQVARTLQEALSLGGQHLATTGGDEVMIIGGARVYAEAIHCWDRLYLTVVDGQFKGTIYFPVRELLHEKWRPVGRPETHPADEKNAHPHSFHVIERVRDAGDGSAHQAETCTPAGPADPNQPPETADLDALLARGTMSDR